jgi:unsaturated rhamnogalacturonyl hydrolase
MSSPTITSSTIHQAIALLTKNLVSITDTTGKFLLRLSDGRVIDTKGWHGWEWTHGIGLYGLYNYYSLTGSQDTLSTIRGWFDEQLALGTTKNINTVAPFLTLAYLYEDAMAGEGEGRTRAKTWRPWLETWAEYLMHDLPRTRMNGFQHETYLEVNENELWDDTLMMSGLPLAKIGLVLNRPEYINEAKYQFLLHCQYLFDHETGLFFHGWKFYNEEDQEREGKLGHNFARARWARGNSWLTIAIPDFIEMLDLKPEDPLRIHLINILAAQCAALKKCQAENGMWRTLLDVPTSYEESSATAGFACGMLKAIRKRYISPDYLPIATKAVKAVLERISEEGELRDVSFGTGMGRDLQHYLDIPLTSMPYGQSMAIMALGEFLRTFI